nr:kelch repeat-containing protein [Acidobacteriota bacterium]
MPRRVSRILLVSSVVLLVIPSLHGSVVTAARDQLTIEERVEYQLRLERLAHARRIELAPEPKPTFEQAMPPGAARTKVERSLALSAALGTFWQRPLTASQLQAEIGRLARDSKQPDRLREMFAALGDDPVVIAECLARPLLAERLAREWYAFDQRFHGALEKRVEAEVASIASGADSKSAGGAYSEAILRRRTSPGAAGDAAASGSDGRDSLDADSWDELLRALADRFGVDDPSRIPIGIWSPLERTATDFEIQAVLERTPDSIRVASLRWEKASFDAWWEGVRGALEKDAAAAAASPTSPYELPVIRGSGCGADDTWRPTQGLPNARFGHSAVWTGAEMIVWGGGDPHDLTSVNSGGRYDPATDSWTPTSVGTGVPRPRHSHTAVWTGTEMVIWGGFGSGTSGYVNTGARYNPATDRWTPTSVDANAPSARCYHTAVWTGT